MCAGAPGPFPGLQEWRPPSTPFAPSRVRTRLCSEMALAAGHGRLSLKQTGAQRDADQGGRRSWRGWALRKQGRLPGGGV